MHKFIDVQLTDNGRVRVAFEDGSSFVFSAREYFQKRGVLISKYRAKNFSVASGGKCLYFGVNEITADALYTEAKGNG